MGTNRSNPDIFPNFYLLPCSILSQHYSTRMGNSFSAPRQRSQFDMTTNRDDGVILRNMFQKIADEAEANAKLGRQKYERRKRREEEGSRPNNRYGE